MQADHLPRVAVTSRPSVGVAASSSMSELGSKGFGLGRLIFGVVVPAGLRISVFVDDRRVHGRVRVMTPVMS